VNAVPWNGSAPNQQTGRTDGVRVGDDVYQQQAAAPVSVDATLFDVHDTDLKDMINACLKKDGGNTATADLPMGGFKFTNVAEAAARTQYARFSQLQDNKGQYVGTVGGTADAITLTPSPAITAYAAGQRFTFIAAATNTGATTVNISGVGAANIAGTAGGEIGAGLFQEIIYDGTQFVLLSGGVPIGAVSDFAGSAAPARWLLCYGQAISRTTYAALFSVVGETYGAGDSSTTFNVPDLRGRVVAGQDDMGGSSANRLTDQSGGLNGDTLGASGGSETHTLTEGQLPSHTHAAGTLAADSGGSHTHVYSGNAGSEDNNAEGGVTKPLRTNFASTPFSTASGTEDAIESGGAHTHTVSGSTGAVGSGTAHNNVQPTFILNKIIFAGV
jgi:microcystin-dependent protein